MYEIRIFIRIITIEDQNYYVVHFLVLVDHIIVSLQLWLHFCDDTHEQRLHKPDITPKWKLNSTGK